MKHYALYRDVCRILKTMRPHLQWPSKIDDCDSENFGDDFKRSCGLSKTIEYDSGK